MLKRQTSGSVICTSCGVLVGVNDDKCYNCGRRNPGLWGYAPVLRALGTDLGFVPFVIGTCVVLFVLTLIFSNGIGGGGNPLAMMSPSTPAVIVFGASGAIPVFELGRWWTVLSAGWLHAGILHILMNMMAVRQLAWGVADIFGPGRMVVIYTAGGVVGFTASSLAGEFLGPLPFIGGGQLTLGASASIAGLIGAILAYGHRSGSGMARSYANYYIVMLLVIGVILPRIDNWAHAGGFAGGYLCARIFDPLKPERVDHIVMALACIGASLLAIVVSIITVLPLLGGR